MTATTKSTHLQIRLTAAEKSAIQAGAERAGLDMSRYVLDRVLPPVSRRLQSLVDELVTSATPKFVLAEINQLLSGLTRKNIADALAIALPSRLDPYLANYVAAMVEQACARSGIAPPAWVHTVAPLEQPRFASELPALRLHLLKHSPAPFRRRNIFVDASVGDQC